MRNFVQFTMRHGKDVFIYSSKIVAFREDLQSTEAEPLTSIFVATESESEEWVVSESVESVRDKLERIITVEE